ncbi:MAG: hybrid sensor histidine kinase/response regulator [Methanomicrobiales archaeon]|nr:hybrid sensor histidine kinase/response regulator [Methanomicrobiales archaeon]
MADDKPVTVLIVEDSRTQAEILKATLEKHGYSPVLAENGKEALEVLETLTPDVIISDVVMPVMDGYEFCRIVKNDARWNTIPFILLTMLTDSKDVVYAMVSGADNFITKPYQGEYLVSRLKKILSSHDRAAGFSGDSSADVILSGKKFSIPHDRGQIIQFLLSAYEAAVMQHQEVLVAQKRLCEANEEANLYLDIITHDINNVNTGALALTELLHMKADEKSRPIAQRLVASINQSAEIIGNVSTIRRLHEKKEALRDIDLDSVIRHEIQRYSSGGIHYAGTDVHVMADTLLGQVFTNLLGNSMKFSGPGPDIHISVENRRDHVEVVVADNGPGIPDAMKPVVFDRFRKGKGPRSGKGLGLFIARTLVESYGGSVWAADRVDGNPENGAAIHFTLKKAP